MLDFLAVVLVRPKYPENIGASARALMNMGCPNLVLVAPRELDLQRALPMATVQAQHVLESARVHPDLASALADFQYVLGTTARTGGWRKSMQAPEQAARAVLAKAAEGSRVALVFGPEDAGLTNEETVLCHQLVTIPTHAQGTSLNLAQAVLILLYECRKAALDSAPAAEAPGPKACSHAEQEALIANIHQTLAAIDFLPPDNHDYWMIPIRRFLARFTLRRTEFDMLMGVCRQVHWAITGRKKP